MNSVANTVNNVVSNAQQDIASSLVQSTSELEDVSLSSTESSVATEQLLGVTNFSGATLDLIGAPLDLGDTFTAYLENGTALIPVVITLEAIVENAGSVVTEIQLLNPQTTVSGGNPK